MHFNQREHLSLDLESLDWVFFLAPFYSVLDLRVQNNCFPWAQLYTAVPHIIKCLLNDLGTSTPPPENTSSTPAEGSVDSNKPQDKVVKVDPLLENKLLEFLCEPSLAVPVDSFQLTSSLSAKVIKSCKTFRKCHLNVA